MQRHAYNREKTEWINKYKVLEKDERNLLKDNSRNLTAFKKIADKDYASLVESNTKYENETKYLKSNLTGCYAKICRMIIGFRSELNQLKLSSNALDTLKSLIEEINVEISGFKKSVHFKLEEFGNDEKLLTKEISVYERKIEAWLTNSDTNGCTLGPGKNQPESVIKKLNESNLLPEVVEFDKYLIQSGGHNGGWDSIDHNLFLKIRNKHKGHADFQVELVNLIGTKSRDEIEVHEKWYSVYLKLNEQKKMAIQEWKTTKQSERAKVFDEAEAELKIHEEIDRVIDEATKKRRQQEREERIQRLEEWKKKKEVSRRQEEELKRLDEQKRVEQEQKKLEEQMRLKEKVNEYKQAKQQLNEFIEMENMIRQDTMAAYQRPFSREEIAYFQQRDLENVKSRMAKSRAKKTEREEKQKRLERAARAMSHVEIKHDPTRLYQMTTAWKSRLVDMESDDVKSTARSSSGACDSHRSGITSGVRSIATMPRLAVPTWRQHV